MRSRRSATYGPTVDDRVRAPTCAGDTTQAAARRVWEVDRQTEGPDCISRHGRGLSLQMERRPRRGPLRDRYKTTSLWLASCPAPRRSGGTDLDLDLDQISCVIGRGAESSRISCRVCQMNTVRTSLSSESCSSSPIVQLALLLHSTRTLTTIYISCMNHFDATHF